MQCEKFEQRVNELLDAREHFAVDPQVGEHVRQCASCRELLTAYEALFDGLEARALPEPSERFAEQVLAKLPERSTSYATMLKWLVPATIAAAALLALRPLWTDAPQNNPNALEPESIASAPPLADDPANPTAEYAEQEQYLTMLRRTGQAMATLPNTVRRADEGPMAGGLRPLTHSFSAAFDALRRTLPSKPTESES